MQALLRNLLQDLKYAVRQLRNSPGFTITAVLTLAIGIGVNTASFSIMDAVVLRPLAVPDLNRVVVVYEQKNHGDTRQVALANFVDWQRQSRSFEELSVRADAPMSLTGAGDAAQVWADYTSPSFFSVLRTNASLGRVFDKSETEPGRSSVAVLSYAFWKSHFGADASILGHTIELDQHAYTVIGVMPKAMQYPSRTDVFLPFAPNDAELANRASHGFLVVGRLRKGVTPGQAQSDLNVIAGHLSHDYPATNLGWQARVETLLADANGEETPLYFNLVQGATLFVLLVVCANIANLQFARGIARRPEIAMRTALGAGRGRLLRQLLTENILLGLVGGAGGLLFAAVDMHLSEISMPERVARFMAGWSNISLDGRTLAFSLLLAVGAGVISGFAPALAALRINLVDQLKSGSRAVVGSGRTRKLRNVLAVSQIALAVALVIGATLMCKGMLGMLHQTDPYNPAHMLKFNVHLPEARYDSPLKLAAWYNQSLDRLRTLPGVEHAELTSALPYTDDAWTDEAQIENRPLAPGQSQTALRLPVSAGYFNAFHISLNSGRLFSSSDDLHTQPVAVVSRAFAARYFPGENPLGRHIRMGAAGAGQTPWLTIVGVVEETTYSLWLREHPAAVYLDAAQLPPNGITYAITTSGDPLAIAPAARKALAALDPALPLNLVQTYAQYTNEELTGMFYVAAMLGFDALVALLLAAIGIFGVMANLVGERTREIGVRLAMGAQREDVLRMILRRAGWLTAAGVSAGLVLAFALAHGVANLLYHVSPNDPVVFSAITGTVTVVALLASWLPARRAARIDPMAALRDE
ncbi:MAG: ABC transporter permease [Terracidiphilus sp.]|nr:ABC transporter permease [Terracidiphilus sp.]